MGEMQKELSCEGVRYGAAGEVLTHLGWLGTEVALAWMGAKGNTMREMWS